MAHLSHEQQKERARAEAEHHSNNANVTGMKEEMDPGYRAYLNASPEELGKAFARARKEVPDRR